MSKPKERNSRKVTQEEGTIGRMSEGIQDVEASWTEEKGTGRRAATGRKENEEEARRSVMNKVE